MLNIIILISIIFILFLSFLLLTEKKKPIFVNPFISKEKIFELQRNFIAYDSSEIQNLLRKLNGSTRLEISAMIAQKQLIKSVRRDYPQTIKRYNKTMACLCR